MAIVAVTGASGFIGQRLVQALNVRGDTVVPVGRTFPKIDCDKIYHLACPSSTATLNSMPTQVMDTIFDKTREALAICPSALFINASSMGVLDLVETAQGAYNIAKRCMEVYLKYSGREYINYRIPSVYGPRMNPDGFIRRCVEGQAYYPPEPDKIHYIAHVDDVVDALVNLTTMPLEEITLGQIYESFNSGRRGLHRPAPDSHSI